MIRPRNHNPKIERLDDKGMGQRNTRKAQAIKCGCLSHNKLQNR